MKRYTSRSILIVVQKKLLNAFREHNRIVGLIKENYPDMDGEELFQQARRLVIAEIQNIVYGEYLPLILGKTTSKTNKSSNVYFFRELWGEIFYSSF